MMRSLLVVVPFLVDSSPPVALGWAGPELDDQFPVIRDKKIRIHTHPPPLALSQSKALVASCPACLSQTFWNTNLFFSSPPCNKLQNKPNLSQIPYLRQRTYTVNSARNTNKEKVPLALLEIAPRSPAPHTIDVTSANPTSRSDIAQRCVARQQSNMADSAAANGNPNVDALKASEVRFPPSPFVFLVIVAVFAPTNISRCQCSTASSFTSVPRHTRHRSRASPALPCPALPCPVLPCPPSGHLRTD